jgi:hypothetical protein
MRKLTSEEVYKKISILCFNFFQKKHGNSEQKFKVQVLPNSYLVLFNVYSNVNVLNFSYLLYIVDSDNFPDELEFMPDDVRFLNLPNPAANSAKRILLTAINEKLEPFNDKFYNLTSEIEANVDW